MSSEKYLPGYWKAEAVKMATDAYVFQVQIVLKVVACLSLSNRHIISSIIGFDHQNLRAMFEVLVIY